MKPQNVPEMKHQLETIKMVKEYEELFETDIEALNRDYQRPQVMDWADQNGIEFMLEYFLLAVDPARRNQLAEIAHLRSKAWFAVWKYFGVFQRQH